MHFAINFRDNIISMRHHYMHFLRPLIDLQKLLKLLTTVEEQQLRAVGIDSALYRNSRANDEHPCVIIGL